MSKLDLTNLATDGITPSYVSVDIAAALMGVSHWTVRRWITAGALPARKLPSGGLRVAVAGSRGGRRAGASGSQWNAPPPAPVGQIDWMNISAIKRSRVRVPSATPMRKTASDQFRGGFLFWRNGDSGPRCAVPAPSPPSRASPRRRRRRSTARTDAPTACSMCRATTPRSPLCCRAVRRARPSSTIICLLLM